MVQYETDIQCCWLQLTTFSVITDAFLLLQTLFVMAMNAVTDISLPP